MKKNSAEMEKRVEFFRRELKNFEDIARYLKPVSGEIPELEGIDIYGESLPLNGLTGGDHITYVDFKKRYDLDSRIMDAEKSNRPDLVRNLQKIRRQAGILIADVSGHKITDAALAAMLHQAFLIGVLYELKQNGQVTIDLFENLNTRFFNSSSLSKFITLIYGEISEKGRFRFINAGHPPPILFSSKYNQLIKVCGKRIINSPPIGTIPSQEDIDIKKNLSRLGYKKKYSIKEINLLEIDDILLLYTDGLLEHYSHTGDFYFPSKFEEKLKKVKRRSAKEIFNQIKKDISAFGKPSDDISMVVIKKIK
jgi:serine phosphatase RsbU (regulator of sigma subunit)